MFVEPKYSTIFVTIIYYLAYKIIEKPHTMEKTTIKDAVKNFAEQTSKKVLDAFAKEKFLAKFRDCKNTWYKGYEVVNECTIKVKYAFNLNNTEQSGQFPVEL